MQGAELDIGDLFLVRKTASKGKHKIQDRWESNEYQVIGQPNPGIPVYKVGCVAGCRTRVLHRNLLLPLQCPEEEEDEDSGMPGVPRAPQVRARRRNVSPQSKPTQHMVASDQDASADLKSMGSSDFRQCYIVKKAVKKRSYTQTLSPPTPQPQILQ